MLLVAIRRLRGSLWVEPPGLVRACLAARMTSFAKIALALCCVPLHGSLACLIVGQAGCACCRLGRSRVLRVRRGVVLLFPHTLLPGQSLDSEFAGFVIRIRVHNGRDGVSQLGSGELVITMKTTRSTCLTLRVGWSG